MNRIIEEIRVFLKRHLYLTFTLIFILLFTIAQLPFEMRDGAFTFKGFFSEPSHFLDSLKQHIIFMYDYVANIKAFLFNGQDFPLYHYDLGFGGDFITSYSYYALFDPLNIIAYIIPLSKIGLSYFLIMTIRVYLSGLFMILLAKKLGIRKYGSLLAVGLVYAFSSPILYSAFRHPFFINGPMYLPLLMLGAERILEKKNPLLFIIAVFFSAISQFYFFVYVAIGFSVYFIFRQLDELRNKKFQSFLLIGFYAILGTLMASFFLYPTFLALKEGSRTASKGIVAFSLYETLSILGSHLIPVKGVRYSNGIGNVILLLGSFLYFFDKKSPHPFIKWSFITFFVLGFSSLFGFMVNGFTYANNRWLFIIMVPVTLAFGFTIDGQVKPSLSSYKKTYRIFFLIMFMTFLLGFIHIMNLLNVSNVPILVVSLILVVLPFRMYNKLLPPKWFLNLLSIQKYRMIVLSVSICTLFIVTITYTFDHTPKNAFEIYYPNDDVYQDFFTDEPFYRVEHKIYDANMDRYSNDNLMYGFKSTYQYNSMASGYVGDYFDALEIINLNGSTGYNGLGNRSHLMTLNQVRYVIIRESEKTLPPFGFEYVKSVDVPKYDDESFKAIGSNLVFENGELVYEKAHIYENKNFIDFGYMMFDSLNTETFESLDYLEKQKALLNYVILDDGNEVERNELTKSQFITIEENIKIEDNIYQFTIPQIVNQEVYILVEGLTQENHRSNFQVFYETKDVRIREINSPIGKNTYKENTTQLAHLGYYDTKENLKVKIEFTEGIYDIKRISYGLLETGDLENKAKLINNHTLENITFEGDGFNGNITAPEDGYLIITLPYSKGFTAKINGKETEVLKANIGFMAIKVPEGNHEITFSYMTPGLYPSLLISGLAFMTTIGVGVTVAIKNKRLSKKISYKEGRI